MQKGADEGQVTAWGQTQGGPAGQDEFNAAAAGEGDGFAGADFVRAGEMFLQLAALNPWQEGFQAACRASFGRCEHW